MAIKFLNTATAATQAVGDNSTKIATTAYADAAASAIPIGNYLPLSAGSTKPLTGPLYIPHYIYHVGDAGTFIGFPANDRLIIGTNGGTRVDITNSGFCLGDSGSNISVSTILDEDDMASDSATALVTQQSIKAYVDAQTPGAGVFLPLAGGTMNTNAAITMSGSLTTSANVYAQRFYDQGNNAYYGDFEGTSQFNHVKINSVLGTRNFVSGSYGWQLEQSTTTTDPVTFRFDNQKYRVYAGGGAGEIMTFLEGGNIGIGTTSPSEKLEVVGNIYAQNRIISADVSLPNKNLLPEASIKVSNLSDIYANAAKTVISPYEARYVNDNTGSTTIRATTATLVSGEVYTVSIYYKDLIGSLAMDLGDTALTGSYKSATGTAAIPTSGRIYGYAVRNSNNYEFIDINLSQAGSVTLLNIKLEQGKVVTEFIATPSTQAVPQTLTTNNIIATGNVGIGTASPGYKLDVSSGSAVGARISTSGFTNLDLVSNRTSGNLGGLRFKQDIDATQTGEFLGLHGGGFDWKVGDGSVAPDIKMRLDSSGELGIGTTAPAARLHVKEPSGSTSQIKMSAASNEANYGYLTMLDNTVNTAKLTFGTTYGYNTQVDAMTIFNGDVGIGKSAPAQKLDVAGGSICNKQFQRDNSLAVTLGTPRVLSIGYRGANGTYTFNPVTLFGNNAQGGQCELQVTGWMAKVNNGIIHWRDDGSNTNIGNGTVGFIQTAVSGTGTISVSVNSGTNNITITFANWHSNAHGWNAKLISHNYN